MSASITQPGQLEPAAGDFPRLRLPTPGLFAARARRLRDLAPGQGMAPFLRFAAALAEAQERLWAGLAPDPLPCADVLAACRAAAMPPLAAPAWWPAAGWQGLVRRLAADLASQAPAPAVLDRLAAAPSDWLEAQARALLARTGPAPDPGPDLGLDLAAAPLIGAVLQVCWTGAAARLTPGDLAPPGRTEAQPGACPVCGSPPVAAVLRSGGAQEGLRYLHCGLCATEWHGVRAQCSQCGNSRGVAYLSLADGAPSPTQPTPLPPRMQAEVCPACRGYLKLCRLELDPQSDPWADDLATLALDLLVDQEGFARAGLNFLLLQGGAAAP